MTLADVTREAYGALQRRAPASVHIVHWIAHQATMAAMFRRSANVAAAAEGTTLPDDWPFAGRVLPPEPGRREPPDAVAA